MKETQDTVWSWINSTFPGNDPESPRMALRALEEMIELCLASGVSMMDIYQSMQRVYFSEHKMIVSKRKYMLKSHRSFAPDKVPSEAADVLIVLYGLAGSRGFDLHNQVESKMAINRSRRWKACGDGTGYHIKDQPAEDQT